MRKLHTLAFALIGLVLIVPAASGAQIIQSHEGVIQTYNKTSYKVWITVYDLGKTRHLDYGMVEPHDVRDWKSGGYLWGSYYHVRGEVIDAKTDKHVFDTTIQVTPHLCYGMDNVPTPTISVNLVKGTGESFYWEKNDRC
ncbi:MAG TPA: hypothetical protein VKT72_09750 [Candidatus Baltobacteraceae bacterium]|nr:hypothetical protein [Candidatus Baltobacteraceae bacterium]